MASHTKPRQHERLSGWWGNPQYLHFSLSEFQIISAKVCIWHACMTRLSIAETAQHTTGETNRTDKATCATSHHTTNAVERFGFCWEERGRVSVHVRERKIIGNTKKGPQIACEEREPIKIHRGVCVIENRGGDVPCTESIWIVQHLMCDNDTEE